MQKYLHNYFLSLARPFPVFVRSSGSRSSGLSLENVALRGTQLKNTEFAFGCAVYTGHDTKMSRNSKITSNKFSTVEKSMNK